MGLSLKLLVSKISFLSDKRAIPFIERIRGEESDEVEMPIPGTDVGYFPLGFNNIHIHNQTDVKNRKFSIVINVELSENKYDEEEHGFVLEKKTSKSEPHAVYVMGESKDNSKHKLMCYDKTIETGAKLKRYPKISLSEEDLLWKVSLTKKSSRFNDKRYKK